MGRYKTKLVSGVNDLTKIRVYELAKELKISSKQLIELLKSEFDIEVKNHMSVIEDEDAQLIKELYMGKEDDIKEKYDYLQEEELKSAIKTKKTKKNKDKKDSDEDNSDSDLDIVIEMDQTITVKEFSDKLDRK